MLRLTRATMAGLTILFGFVIAQPAWAVYGQEIVIQSVDASELQDVTLSFTTVTGEVVPVELKEEEDGRVAAIIRFPGNRVGGRSEPGTLTVAAGGTQTPIEIPSAASDEFIMVDFGAEVARTVAFSASAPVPTDASSDWSFGFGVGLTNTETDFFDGFLTGGQAQADANNTVFSGNADNNASGFQFDIHLKRHFPNFDVIIGAQVSETDDYSARGEVGDPSIASVLAQARFDFSTIALYSRLNKEVGERFYFFGGLGYADHELAEDGSFTTIIAGTVVDQTSVPQTTRDFQEVYAEAGVGVEVSDRVSVEASFKRSDDLSDDAGKGSFTQVVLGMQMDF